ncbi:hypothetical protein HYH03_013869 [Edaphochlamys debaryana]|uniref:Uncharacterized protein n=1 Tax=Edaphochlamys debaryana TaxID=47281 RepID=A0A835XQ49_9CHLO|nr:hypothetical protein HYH03_013869 [Edaphochlamys debaryana]|eukprot:KAG2487590.1 hypothetical protein HYH03_013869 [Edaphochlamys debaryana]
MVVLRLDAGKLNRQAKRRHGPAAEPPGRPGGVGAGGARAAQDKLARISPNDEESVPGGAILRFLKEVQVPGLVLCDEAHGLFLPTIGCQLDYGGAAYIRQSFMKTLLAYGSHTTLWCLTGSSMASTWVSLADMPPNGYPVFLCIITAVLPATYSPGHMRWAWDRLQVRSPGVALDPRLLH